MSDILNAITKEKALATYSGPDRVERLPVVLEEYRKTHPEQQGHRTGFPTLDKELSGFFSGQLVVISGPSGHGKTTLAQAFTRTLVEDGCFPLWLSYEVSVDDFVLGFHRDYREYITMPLTLADNSIAWIEDRIVESKLKHNTRALFVDHLHFLVDLMPKGPNMSLVVGELVRKLKRLAVSHRIVIFLIAHTTKVRFDDEPDLGSVRDSSFIEQEADTVLYVYRFKDDRSLSVCKVAKNRKKGRIGAKIPLVMGPHGYVERVADDR